MNAKIVLFWFRRDLRLEDNTGLYHALHSGSEVLPVFIFDTQILEKLHSPDDRRVSFIFNAIRKLHQKLNEAGSSLLALHGKPSEIFARLAESYDIEAVYANHDYEPYAISRDQEVSEMLKSKGIRLVTFKHQVIFERSEVMKSDGTPYTVFTPYSKAWKQRLSQQGITHWESEKLMHHFFKTEPFTFPDLKSIGFNPVDTPSVQPVLNEEIIQNYHLTRNLPYLEGTSGMSTHLRFGTVSVRQLVARALTLNEAWLNELIWREFFMMILFHHPWVVNQSFKPKYDFIQWRNDEEEFENWCSGQTGYPIVDAGMRQMNRTGLMHNRVRMIVASFLTKHLLIDWRWGEQYFAENLLDFELSSNNGNWQWAAGTGCDAAPYFRIFNPSEQAARYDPDLVYTKKWVTELGTTSYPEPIVDHRFARTRALEAYKKAVQGK